MEPFPGGGFRALLAFRRYDIAIHCSPIDVDGVVAGFTQPCMTGYDIHRQACSADIFEIEARIAIIHLVDIIIDQPARAAIPNVDGIARDIHRFILQDSVIVAAVQVHIVLEAIEIHVGGAARLSCRHTTSWCHSRFHAFPRCGSSTNPCLLKAPAPVFEYPLQQHYHHFPQSGQWEGQPLPQARQGGLPPKATLP